MYRTPSPELAAALEARLGPLGFARVPVDETAGARGVRGAWLRKTWNTRRGVLLVRLEGAPALPAVVEALRAEGERLLGSSWWSQLGLQLVLDVDAVPPEMTGLVDAVNTQGVLVQSVFAVDLATGAMRETRTWGQVITGRFQDAIAAVLAELAVRR